LKIIEKKYKKIICIEEKGMFSDIFFWAACHKT
jgi:hypothetical protein